MCGNCGCGPTEGTSFHGHDAPAPGLDGLKQIPVMQNILDDNDKRAAANREVFEAHSVLAINLMSSPGSGKTRLLEESVQLLGAERMAVIEGDLETENDAERIRAKGVDAFQITTGMACHLDASMVAHGASHLDLSQRDFVFVENVGNLVCPANFDLGQHVNVVLLAVTEGDDKPAKYPIIFEVADLVLITKTDLLPFLDDFEIERARTAINLVNPSAQVIEVSSKSNAGVEEWASWLTDQHRNLLK